VTETSVLPTIELRRSSQFNCRPGAQVGVAESTHQKVCVTYARLYISFKGFSVSTNTTAKQSPGLLWRATFER
jgi:hypothetical protein